MIRCAVSILLLAVLSDCSDSSNPPDLGPPNSNEQIAVDAGSLRLRVTSSPWSMTFVDEAGEQILAELADTGDTPFGTLGVFAALPPEGIGSSASLTPLTMGMPQTPLNREAGWVRATTLQSSNLECDSWVATIATTDPAWLLQVRAHAEGDGIIAISVSAEGSAVQAVSIACSATEGERFVGFGERGNAVNQSGNVLENYVAEGPYQDSEHAFINATVPPPGVRWWRDTTYVPIPWLLSSRGYGVLLDNDEMRNRTAASNAAGTAVHAYFNPMICVDFVPEFDNAQDSGALLRHGSGETYTYDYQASRRLTVSQFEFSAPAGIAAYKALTDEAIAHGYEGWMEDFGAYTPLDAVSADGITGTAFHNRYAHDYQRLWSMHRARRFRYSFAPGP